MSKIVQQHKSFTGTFDENKSSPPLPQEQKNRADETSSSEEDFDAHDDIYNIGAKAVPPVQANQPEDIIKAPEAEDDYLNFDDGKSEPVKKSEVAEKPTDQTDDYLDFGDDLDPLLGDKSGNYNLESDNLSLGSKPSKKEKGKKDDSFDLGSPVLSKKDKKNDSFDLGSDKGKDSLGLDDSLGGGNDSFLGESEKASEKESDPFGYQDASEAVGNDDFDFKDDSFERERKKKEAKQKELEAKRKAEEEERLIELELEKEAQLLEEKKRRMDEDRRRDEELRLQKIKEAELRAAEELKKKMQLDQEDLYFTVGER